MICDILKEINNKYNFRGICERMINDGNHEDYIRLTDSILDKIEDIYDDIKNNKHSVNKDYRNYFRRASELLTRIERRKTYKFVREFHYCTPDKTVTALLKEELNKETMIASISKQSNVPADKIRIVIS